METAGLTNGTTEWDFRLPQRGKEESKNYELDLGDRALPVGPAYKPGSIWQTTALERLLNRARLQAAAFNHREVTIVHVLSAATLTPEAFDALAAMGVNRAALGSACIQLMSSLEVEQPAQHPAQIRLDGHVEQVLLAAERSARIPVEREKQVLGVRELLAEIVERCKQDVRLQQLLAAELGPTAAEQARDEVQRLSERVNDLGRLIGPSASISTSYGQESVSRESLADKLQAQSAQLQSIETQLAAQPTHDDAPTSTLRKYATFAALLIGGVLLGVAAAKLYPSLALLVSKMPLFA